MLPVVCLAVALTVPAVARTVVTAEETKWLMFMREEEKLARDVYRLLYDRWKLPAFDRIAASEQRHFETVGLLLARYEIEDPARLDVAGVFRDAKLAALYAEFTARGTASLKDALEVGITIEKIDIDDLGRALLATARFDLKRVFQNLMTASFHHLEAFEMNWERLR